MIVFEYFGHTSFGLECFVEDLVDDLLDLGGVFDELLGVDAVVVVFVGEELYHSFVVLVDDLDAETRVGGDEVDVDFDAEHHGDQLEVDLVEAGEVGAVGVVLLQGEVGLEDADRLGHLLSSSRKYN